MATQSWRCDWVTEKCEIASALARGEARGSYSEAAILVCAALNALAAEVWPGRGLDRARFIELLVRLSPSPNFPMTISVPLLVQYLESSPSKASAKLLTDSLLPFSPTRVVTGPEVDKMEGELVSICPELTSKTIRKFSYACLLYEEVRSSYAHEYRPGDKADSWPMTMCEGQSVSYVNRLLEAGIPETGRLIHFHIAWLTKLAAELASNVDALSATLPRQAPSSWWIDGAP
jgi:hypothetical protein